MNTKAILITLIILMFTTTSYSKKTSPSLMAQFEKLEAINKGFLELSMMSKLGSQALLEAKITSINIASLEAGNNVTYFKLNHPKDFCRQIFLNGLEYTVHTKCYRDKHVILDFTKTYKK